MHKFSALLVLLLAAAHLVNAHTYLFRLNVNGTDTKRGQYIRPYRESTVNSPVKDPKDKDLRCRTDKMSRDSAEIVTIVAGEEFGLEFHEGDEDDTIFIEKEHRGPGMIYLAPMESNGEGAVWFKIFEKGYDVEKKLFYTQEMMASKGKMKFTIPEDIPGGEYLMRTEFIALHTADTEYKGNKGDGAEYFPNCAQINLISKGTAKPKGHEIPGIYKTDDPGIFFHLWDDDLTKYIIPGPPMYTEELEEGDTVPQEEDQKPVKKPCVRKTKRKRSRN
ncbi:hypothetical protein GGI20_002245 [Coemansia sp. BCRC 34301]|nr:hypothetical protein GGI20_002245 [Coemansia sp. BCRC 34301]